MKKRRGGSEGKRPDLIFRNPVFKAMGAIPMAKEKQVDLKLAAAVALESALQGLATVADRDTLVCVVNVAMVLAETHCSEEDLSTALRAQEALLRADGRALEGKGWTLDEEGRQQLKAALDMHDQQIELLGRAEVLKALVDMQARNDSGQVHRVVLQETPTPEGTHV